MLGAGSRHRPETSQDSSLFNSSSEDDYEGEMLTGGPQLNIEEFFANIDITGGLTADLKTAKIIGARKNKESLIDLDAVPLVSTKEKDSCSDERKWLKRFSEPDSPDNIIYDREEPTSILAAQKEKLVALLTSNADKDFTEGFLTTFHLFMGPEELASMIGVRLRSAYMTDSTDNQNIRLVTFKLIRLWCSQYITDERPISVIEVKRVLNEAVNRVWEDAVMLTLSDKQLLMNLGSVLEPQDKENIGANVKNKSANGKRHGKEKTCGLPKDYEVLLMERSLDIAEQLSLHEESVFSRIDWKDLLDLIQPNKTKTPEQDSLQYAVAHFNGLCRWFVSEVCRSSSVNAQSEKIKKLVKVGYKCMKLGNLSTAFQVSLALQNHSVQTLKEAWERQPKKIALLFQDLAGFTSPLKNFSAGRRATESLDGVPFLGIFISDMKALGETPNDYAADLVPWHKFQMAAKILRRFRDLQDKSTGYQFKRNPELYSFISDPLRYSIVANTFS